MTQRKGDLPHLDWEDTDPCSSRREPPPYDKIIAWALAAIGALMLLYAGVYGL